MYVIISQYLDEQNENVLSFASSLDEAKDIIACHFNEHYAEHLKLSFDNNIGYVYGYYSNPIERFKEYSIVKPFMSY